MRTADLLMAQYETRPLETARTGWAGCDVVGAEPGWAPLLMLQYGQPMARQTMTLPVSGRLEMSAARRAWYRLAVPTRPPLPSVR